MVSANTHPIRSAAANRERTSTSWWRVLRGIVPLTGVSCDWLLGGTANIQDESSVRNDELPLFQDGRAIPPALRVVIAGKNAG